ncbi:hypothetical protein EDB86DRAFT_2955688 [Lactarius hatsudake]|nr:hypothetical protein EDB86DRAFT_2955688 [Lactarius hatsudake]
MTILNAQRLAFPSGGPRHLTIYRPQLTWLASTAKRITGCSALRFKFALRFSLSRLSRRPFHSHQLKQHWLSPQPATGVFHHQ